MLQYEGGHRGFIAGLAFPESQRVGGLSLVIELANKRGGESRGGGRKKNLRREKRKKELTVFVL